MAKKKKTAKRSLRKGEPPRRPPGAAKTELRKWVVDRVQTGVRMEKRLLKVLKALAEYHDITLGDLLESIVLHAFDGKCAFSPESRRTIDQIKNIYQLDLDSSAGHHLVERGDGK